MFRVIVNRLPEEKLHHAVSVMAALGLAHNPTALYVTEDADGRKEVRGDWMNGLMMPPDVLVKLQQLRDSLPRGTAVSLVLPTD